MGLFAKSARLSGSRFAIGDRSMSPRNRLTAVLSAAATFFVSLAPGGARCEAPQPARTTDVRQLKDMYLKTWLAKDGKSVCKIVPPNEDSWRQLGGTLQAAMEAKIGIRSDMVLADAVTEGDFRQSNMIVLGNLNNNEVVRRLYANLIPVWDLIEEGEAFSDGDRLKITNLLLNITRWVSHRDDFDERTESGRRQSPVLIRRRQNLVYDSGAHGEEFP